MHKGLAARILITWLIRKKQNWNQPKRLTIGGWLKNVSSIHVIELCIAIKNDVYDLKIWKYVHGGVSEKISMNGLTLF